VVSPGAQCCPAVHFCSLKHTIFRAQQYLSAAVLLVPGRSSCAGLTCTNFAGMQATSGLLWMLHADSFCLYWATEPDNPASSAAAAPAAVVCLV
jgi:hypothetical protein